MAPLTPARHAPPARGSAAAGGVISGVRWHRPGMATVQRLTERNAPVAFAPNADLSAPGVCKGVVLCGLESANGRVYPPKVLAAAREKYEGAQVYLDHARGGERGVREWFGEVRNVTYRPDGRPQGDIHYPATHAFAAEFQDRAANFPRSLGMSHVVLAQTARGADGRDVIEAIDTVESVDLVASPATNRNGLLESHRRSAVAKISLKQFAERVGPKLGPAKWSALAKLCEDFPAAADAPMVDEPPAEGGGEADLKAALMSAITPMLDDAFESGDASKLIAALKDFIKLHAKHTGKGGGTAEAETEKPAEESKKGLPVGAITETLALFDRLKVTGFSGADLTDVASVPAERRESLAKRLFAGAAPAGGERPESASREQTGRYREEREAVTKVNESRAGTAAAKPVEFVPY